MIDRNYRKVVVLCYPRGAGGNFLINCLSLNDQCVLRDAQLAEQQLFDSISPAEKINYFKDQLIQSLDRKQWQDLNLGCANLFGVDGLSYLLTYPEVIQQKFNYIIPQLISKSKYLFIVAHTTQYLDAYLKFWPQARVIFLTDYSKFIQQRGYVKNPNIKSLSSYWLKVKGVDWPDLPPTSRVEFSQLPKSIQNELKTNFHSEIFKWFETSPTVEELHNLTIAKYNKQMGNQSYMWSVEENFTGDKQKFLDNLNDCAQWLGVTIDVPNETLFDYYNSWLDVIFKISTFILPYEQE